MSANPDLSKYHKKTMIYSLKNVICCFDALLVYHDPSMAMTANQPHNTRNLLNSISRSCRLCAHTMCSLTEDPRVSPLHFSPPLTFMFRCKADDRGENMQVHGRWDRIIMTVFLR